MTDAQIGFLYKISSLLNSTGGSHSATFLKSYYLMRCKDLTRGYGLPEKHFSTKKRCPHCCLDWTKGTSVKVKSIKLSRRQKKRIRSTKSNDDKQEYIKQRKLLLRSNEMVQICEFCKCSTTIPLIKPKILIPERTSLKNAPNEAIQEPKVINNNKKRQNKVLKEPTSNVYSSTFDVFSLKNQNNTLASAKKVEPKIITNNKKKKDKFAGLCQQAVLATAKLKEQKDKQNKLNLFLKPSK